MLKKIGVDEWPYPFDGEVDVLCFQSLMEKQPNIRIATPKKKIN